MSQNEDNKKGEGNQNQGAPPQPNKPKKIKKLTGKMDPNRSKSAPAVEDIGNEEENDNYISSYNYYLYYNSIKPVDPRLPKPTYTPKPNLEFIRESKPKDEEDDEPGENQNMNEKIENVTKEMEKLNIEQNSENNTNEKNSQNEESKNNQDDEELAKFNQNYYSKNQPQINQPKSKNASQNAPSPLLNYYASTSQNDKRQLNGDNLNMGNIYGTPGMLNMPNMMPNMKINPMNPFMNPAMNAFPNMSPYGNMMQFQMMNNDMNVMNQMNNNGQYQKNKKKNTQNKGNNLEFQNQMNNNMYQERIGQQFYQQANPLMNMGQPGMNYIPNEQNIKLMPQIAGYSNGGMIQNEANIPMTLNFPMNLAMNYNMNGIDPYHQYQNINMPQGFQNQNMMNNNLIIKKKSKGQENPVSKKDIDNKNLDEIIEKAVEYSKDHSGSRQVQKKYDEGNEEVRNKIFEKLKPEILNLSKDIFGNYAIQKILE